MWGQLPARGGPRRGSQSLPESSGPRQLRANAVGSERRMSVLQVEQRGNALRIRVRVKPRASKSRILPVREGILEIALAAPPVDGEANAELIRTLADTLDCPKSAIEIVTGAGSRSKLIGIVGLTLDELLAKLEHTGA